MKTVQQSYLSLARALGIDEVYLKREDEHPYGSHKGRSIPLMIKEYVKRDDIRDFVISSSGNAALAAAIAVQKHNQNNPSNPIRLRIFVGQHIPMEKLSRLRPYLDPEKITVEQVDRPKQTAFQVDAAGTAKNLRQSTDDLALVGYNELAQDLCKIPNLCAVFVPTSSGTTAQALAQSFARMNPGTQVHVVQTEACFPIAQTLGAHAQKTEQSIAGAIVDNVAHRKDACAAAVKQTGGAGWIVSDDEIRDAMSLTKKETNISISSNSALSVAGLKKALATGWTCSGAVVCLVTGA
ncbi:MAG: hypothetical protein COU35_00215 [Candidatus Magasanikbacteria bacterium CG10_big_fil_rev_8_21_14_0_10_47_10]|uniref:Tryptophan synthase beta chain-like PALP domain-containing protein n=1 Tax=Candidatus Magasanikbacteria bacterium CG10_big_fil_rev_8_21_14_0_10_47_10 TaxID=1974652 RepID=A0A2H0TRU1_9BACT|nr:MAG: hypothetical protein COU35_00215 [Candidatus Magasanikbacteria bacterium CG10_big_fil_rev_8_21_14_0_10_47_10]